MSQQESSLLQVLKELECPVCNEYMHTNIPMCIRGHSLCLNCRKQLEMCPICKSAFGSCRNYAIEELINSIIAPCPSNMDGCKFEGTFPSLEVHKQSCQFRKYQCPLNSQVCQWTGKWNLIQKHLTEAHEKYNYTYTFDIATSVAFIFLNDVTFKINRKYNDEIGLVTWVAQYFGPSSKEKDFLLRVEFVDHNKIGMELTMTAECSKHCQDQRDVFKHNPSISIPIKMLEYFRFGEIYTHRVEIIQKK